MKELLLLLSLSTCPDPVLSLNVCPDPVLINHTEFPWTAEDYESRDSAQRHCKEYYGQDAPCLVKFIKRDIRSYWALCGKR